MFIRNWFTLIILFGMSSCFLILVALLLRAFYSEIREWAIKSYGSIKTFSHSLHRKYGALIHISKKIHRNDLSYSIDIIFQLFNHFYELYQHEMEHWGFDKELFPEGRRDMSDMYRWIKKIRNDNYEEAKNIVASNGHLEYWGVPYRGFKFRVNSKHELVITPHDDSKSFVFERVAMRMYNSLYALDTEKCMWILERRKFFGF